MRRAIRCSSSESNLLPRPHQREEVKLERRKKKNWAAQPTKDSEWIVNKTRSLSYNKYYATTGVTVMLGFGSVRLGHGSEKTKGYPS